MTVEEFRRMHLRRQKTKQVRELEGVASSSESRGQREQLRNT